MIGERGYCLVSQQIRNRILQGSIIPGSSNFSRLRKPQGNRKAGWFVDQSLESRIQPASYDTRTADYLFVLGEVRTPEENREVREMILGRLPKHKRHEVDIREGYELRRGFSYLIKICDQIILEPDEHVISSTKSSRGRLFLRIRLLADYNPCFDEIDGSYHPGEPIGLWLLVQPIKHNVIIHPGVTLNQLRFFKGNDARLNDKELHEQERRNPLLYEQTESGLVPAEHVIRGGLQLHLGLRGTHTFGISGLKAINNPKAIDLLKKGYYEPEEFHEPIACCDGFSDLEDRDCSLYSSFEYLKMPSYLSAQLHQHSPISTESSLHDAGFIDPRFQGEVVAEVRAREHIRLRHRMPFSKLDFFRTSEEPDKVYGREIGSSYSDQVGPRIANNFKPFDFEFAARNFGKLDRIVLVQDHDVLQSFRKRKTGFEFLKPENLQGLLDAVNKGFFHSRYDCDPKGPGFRGDELAPQIIPYHLLFLPRKRVFVYQRASDRQLYGESQLFGKFSIAVGGHIIPEDAPDHAHNCLSRETSQEVSINGKCSEPVLVGTLMAYKKPVDRVHFGLIYASYVQGTVSPSESSIKSGSSRFISSLQNHSRDSSYETWTQMMIPHLSKIYDIVCAA